jgi:ADP-ribose pyrophosphatase
MASMPERFASDELIFRGRVAEFHRVGVRMPDGKVVQRDFIHYNGAVVILPVLADGSIVLIRNCRFAVQENLLELPAGMLDGQEDPQDAAVRELIEETGYRAGKMEKLGLFFTGPGTCDERMHSFLATDLQAGAQDLEDYEQITVEVHGDEEVRRMVVDGRIHDAKTIATLGLYWLGKPPNGSA